MNNPEIIIGSRGSRLALTQANWVVNRLKQKVPNISCVIKVIKTSGDKGNIDRLGAFVCEIEQALLQNEVDFAVHSFKDMPAIETPGLHFASFPDRDDPREVLVLKKNGKFERNKKYRIGTGSPRRKLLLQYYFPKIEVVPIRGNVDTRIGFVDNGEIDGLVLAAAGLKRLGLENRITHYFPMDEFYPPPGQGILALQTRSNDFEMKGLLKRIDTVKARVPAVMETTILKEISGGCSIPLGACVEWVSDYKIKFHTFYGLDSRRQLNNITTSLNANTTNAEIIDLATKLKNGHFYND